MPIDPWTIYSRVAPAFFIPVLLIIGLIFFLIFRKNRFISRRILFIDSIIIMFILISSGLIWAKNINLVLKTTQFLNLEVPQSVQKIADTHFIEIAGESYFRKNFRFNRYESVNLHDGSYRISYQFLPLANILGDYPFAATIRNNRVIDATYFPYCVSGVQLCEINLTKDDMGKILKQYTITKDFIFEPPYLKTTLCEDEKFMGTLLVNYVTKEVSLSDTYTQNQGSFLFSPCIRFY